MNIIFEYAGKRYIVGVEAYICDKVVLPNKVVLALSNWKETTPPQVGNIVEVFHTMHDQDVVAIATMLNCAVATEISVCLL